MNTHLFVCSLLLFINLPIKLENQIKIKSNQTVFQITTKFCLQAPSVTRGTLTLQ